LSCTPCNGSKMCPGDPSADPIVLGMSAPSSPRSAMAVADGERRPSERPCQDGALRHRQRYRRRQRRRLAQVGSWSRKNFEKCRAAPAAILGRRAAGSVRAPVPALNGKSVVMSRTRTHRRQPRRQHRVFI
jgi:hypothetical protein